MSKLVGSGRFYRGLYTYLSHTTIPLTPLRERPQDIEWIARHYLPSLANDREIKITDDAVQKMTSHYWTHNIHELKTVLENSIQSDEVEELNEESLSIGEKKSISLIDEDDADGIRLMSLKEAEKLLIKKALIHTSENRTQAAKILGVSIRTLRNKINEYRSGGNAFFVNLR